MVVNGVTGEIIEKGGMELPKQREYSGNFKLSKEQLKALSEESVKNEENFDFEKLLEKNDTKETATNKFVSPDEIIETLKDGLEFVDGADRDAILDRIEAQAFAKEYA
jgi:hypothetical protein